MQENLTEKQKLNIMRNIFRHYPEDALYYYIDLADAKIKSGEAEGFWEAGLQIQKEHMDFKKNNHPKKQPLGKFEEQAKELRELMGQERKERMKEIDKDIQNVFDNMSKDAKAHPNKNKPIEIKDIIIKKDRD